ncbi:MAG: hypothetical protein D6711_04885 [Chloroflexi bacterium]|nr:MAG: hypothetical protein D6711_04885 [Chloroflexota bacterium]
MAAIGRASLALLMTYLFALGGTFNGVLMPELKIVTLVMMTVGLGMWQLVRWRGRWIWHNTPLDLLLILWGVAFGLSLLTNLEEWRRIVIGFWYVGVYLLVWYVLNDALANRKIQRTTLIDAALMGGVVVVFFGFFQLQSAPFDLIHLQFPRPGSVIGNPNSLGAFLVVLGLLSLGRWMMITHRLGRWALGIYSLMILLLLFFTFSRGAWLGMAVGMMVLAGLYFPKAWRHSLTRYRFRWAMAGIVLLMVIGVVGVFFLQSFRQSGRSLSLRATIYQHAIGVFNEHPVAGSGLFTFGAELARYQSQPPRQPHSHAHNGVLHVAAELGTVGLGALVASVVILIAAMRLNLRLVNSRQKGFVITAIGASVGFGVHHLFDFPAMMPVIALMGVLVLVLATAPINPLPIEARWRQVGHSIGLVSLAVVLMVTGGWSTWVYMRYNDTLQSAFPADGIGDYRAAADALIPIVNADPELSVYINQQAYLYGLAANQGDVSALDLGIAAYERYITLEPQDAYGWANLGALYAQAGRYTDAINAMQSAIDAAPDALYFAYLQGVYAQAAGDMTLANAAYTLALKDGTRLWLVWDEQAPLANYIPDARTAAILAIGQGQSTDYVFDDRDYSGKALNILAGHRTEPLPAPQTDIERAWQALVSGDLVRARELIAPDFAREDVVFGANIPYYQFLRFAIPRRFLPQVNYPASDLALAYLIQAFEQFD